MRNIFIYNIFIILIAKHGASCQETVKAEIIVQEPSFNDKSMGYRFNLTSYQHLEKAIVVNELTQIGKKKETINSDDNQLSVITFPTYNLRNRKNGEKWVLVEAEKFKIATRQAPDDTADSSAYFILIYTDKYKIIGQYNCQKVSIINKLTGSQDSLYVTKKLSHLNYRMTYKYGNIDFIMQAFEHYNGLTQTYTIISAKEELIPLSTFEIPHDYICFYSQEDRIKWENDQHKLRTIVQKSLNLPSSIQHE